MVKDQEGFDLENRVISNDPNDNKSASAGGPGGASNDNLSASAGGPGGRTRNALPDKQTQLLEDSFQLFNTYLQNSEISDMLNAAAQMIHNPLIVIDISYNVIAYSTCYDVHDEQWRKNIERGYCSFEYIAGFNEIEGVRNAPDSDDPFKIHCNTSPLRRCLSKLYYRGKQRGYLIAIEAISPFDSMNLKLFQLVSKAVSKELDTNIRISRNSSSSIIDSIFLDLLEEKFVTPEHLRERAAKTNIKLYSSYQVIVFNIMSYTNYDYNSEFLRNYIESIFPMARVLSFKGDVVIIIDTSNKNIDVRQTLENNGQTLQEYSIKVGVSDEGKRLFDLSKYYHQCKEAIAMSGKMKFDDTIAYFNRYKFYIAMLDSNLRSHVEDYFSTEFVRLLNYDIENNTEYVETLQSYFVHQKKLAEVANSLFIHKNTASYRISRIKELFNFDFKDNDFIFNFLYSYRLFEMKQKNLL